MSNRVLVDLDALLDTRLGVMHLLDEQAAVKLVTSDAYYARSSDDFSSITGVAHSRFQEAWDKRDVNALMHSIKTHVPLLLSELITRLEVQEENSPHVDGPLELEVNVWPYTDLSEEERDMILLAVMAHAGIQTIPKVVCIDPKQLTPRVLKTNYSGLILYNLRDWLQHHLQAFPKCVCPQVCVLAPALFNGEVVETKDLTDDPDVRTDLSVFSLTELACIEFFQLNYLDVKHFSIWR